MLDVLMLRCPGLRPHGYSPQGKLYPPGRLFINGRAAQFLVSGPQAVLTAEDTVNIFPPVGGGSH